MYKASEFQRVTVQVEVEIDLSSGAEHPGSFARELGLTTCDTVSRHETRADER